MLPWQCVPSFIQALSLNETKTHKRIAHGSKTFWQSQPVSESARQLQFSSSPSLMLPGMQSWRIGGGGLSSSRQFCNGS
ncbi:hypothetical protein GX48_06384 [Paracoccidioides brasiliensis]|nr:hypothetical protein GX48_06384 [Paracoccidioides brasiliensis]